MREPETSVGMSDGLERSVKLVGCVAGGAGQELATAICASGIGLAVPSHVYVEEGHLENV